MKQELLEYLVRHCIREVITQINEVDNTDDEYHKNIAKLGRIIHRAYGGRSESDIPPHVHKALGSSLAVFTKTVYIIRKKENGVFYFLDKTGSHWTRAGKTMEFKTEDEAKKYLANMSSNNLPIKEQDDEIKGAAAPPAAGQGTADQPPIPPNEPSQNNDAAPEVEAPPPPDMKGVVFINPKDKAKLQKLSITAKDDAGIERTLHQYAARLAGSRVKVSLSASRMVKDALRNPSSSVYLYLGKYDPESNETFLMADKSLQVAKDSSVSAGELTGTPISGLAPQSFQPLTADSDEYASRLASQGQTPPTKIDEKLQKIIKKIVNEILDKR